MRDFILRVLSGEWLPHICVCEMRECETVYTAGFHALTQPHVSLSPKTCATPENPSIFSLHSHNK